jgi:diguanylate cyclase (GGDEF)-like protein/PAS domain S-box-containing protein
MTIQRQMLLYGAIPGDPEGGFPALAQLLDALVTPVSYLDCEHRFLYVNDAFATRLRVDRQRLIGRTIEEIEGRVAYESLRGVLARVLTGEQLTEERALNVGAAGVAWWRSEYYPNRNRAGEVIGYYLLAHDITASRELERALGERGEQVRRLVESVMLPMARWDRDARLVFCNTPYERWIGRPRNEILGHTHAELFGAAAWAVSKTSFDKVFAGTPTTYERQVRRGTTEARWHRIYAFPDDPAQTSPDTMFTIAFDIDDDIRLRQQLAANEARLRSILESIELPIARVSTKYEFTYCNPQFAAYAGKANGEIVGRTIAAVFGDDVFQSVVPNYVRAFSGETVTVDRIATHDTAPRWVRVRLTPDRDATGVARAVLVTVYDIEAEVRAREKLQEARERLDVFADQIPFPLTYLDRDERYQFANKEFLRRHALTSEQVIGHHPIEARGQSIWDEYRPYLQAAMRGIPTSYERALTLADGTSRWTRTIYAPGRAADGSVSGVYTTSFDVHELREAQGEIARVHAQLRAHLAGSPVAVVEYDARGVIVQWSRRAEEILGMTATEMIGKRLTQDLIHPDDRTEVDKTVRRIMQSGSSTVVNTHRYRRSDGRYIWIEWYTTIVRSADDGIQSILSLGIDMQERMEARLRLQRLADKIPNPITYISTDSRYQFANAAFVAWTGIATSAMIGRTVVEVRGASLGGVFQSLIDQALRGEETTIERIATLADGSERWIKTVMTPDFDENGRIVGCYNVSFDVHDSKLREQSLQSAADVDPLTGALTRRAFFAALDRMLAQGDNTVLSVFFADLDGFKAINDRLGHAAGDAVLVDTVSRIRACASAGDIIGRLGGDEIVIVTRSATQAIAREFAERVLASVSSVSLADASDVRLSVSIGIAMTMCRAGSQSSDELLSRADGAMYEAKREGGGQLRFAH